MKINGKRKIKSFYTVSKKTDFEDVQLKIDLVGACAIEIEFS